MLPVKGLGHSPPSNRSFMLLWKIDFNILKSYRISLGIAHLCRTGWDIKHIVFLSIRIIGGANYGDHVEAVETNAKCWSRTLFRDDPNQESRSSKSKRNKNSNRRAENKQTRLTLSKSNSRHGESLCLHSSDRRKTALGWILHMTWQHGYSSGGCRRLRCQLIGHRRCCNTAKAVIK